MGEIARDGLPHARGMNPQTEVQLSNDANDLATDTLCLWANPSRGHECYLFPKKVAGEALSNNRPRLLPSLA